MELPIAIVLLILLALFIIKSHSSRLKIHKKEQQQGLFNVSHLKILISLTQVHRGLSSAWLNGDDTKRSALDNIELKIQSQISTLDEQVAIKDTSRWLSFNDHWARLSRKNINHKSNDSFNQHTQLIANLIYLLEDEAERANLNAKSLQELPSIGFVWRELVVTAENIGQSRAIGTGVATKKECSSVDKIRLSFLHKHIQKTTSDTLVKLLALNNATVQHNKLLNTAKTKISNYCKIIEVELINSKTVTIDQDEYFALATDTMKTLDEIFTHQLEQVKEII